MPAAELEGFEGRTLGSYKIHERIGRGGMAVVFKAAHVKTGNVVAIKVMRPSLDAEPNFRKRIAREAKIAAKLRHPNIVRVHSIQEKDGLFFLVMDYVEGASLFAVERTRGAFPFNEAAFVMKGILEALKFAHGKKVVHRDIKPENVLVDKSGTPLLTDFGIAKPLEGTKLTKTGLALGTPLYMSPEQVRGEADIDVRSDIYSAGVLFYELLCGKVPFDGDDPVAIGYRHVNSAPIFPSCFNKSLSAQQDLFVLKAMEKERIDRYQTIEEMLASLEKLTKGEDLGIELKMQTKRVEISPGMGPMMKAALATLIVGAGIVGAVYMQDGNLNRISPSVNFSLFGEEEVIPRDPIAEAKMLLIQGKYDQAIRMLNEEDRKKALPKERKVELATRFYAEGLKKFEQGDLNLANKLLTTSFRFDSSRSDTCFQLGKLYMKMKKYRLAATYFGQTMRLLDPDRAFEFIKINEPLHLAKLPKGELERVGSDLCEVGRRLYRQKKPDKAVDILRKSLHYKQDQLQAHQTLARIYQARGDTNKQQYHEKKYADLFNAGAR